jgi:hypothetical protein
MTHAPAEKTFGTVGTEIRNARFRAAEQAPAR